MTHCEGLRSVPHRPRCLPPLEHSSEGEGPPLLPLYLPIYSHHHPSVQRIKLVAVKTSLYNPCLPTLRRCDMDSAAQLCAEEHHQTSTTCCKGDFKRVKERYIHPPLRFLSPGIELMEERNRKLYIPIEEINEKQQEWRNFLNCPKPPRAPQRENEPLIFDLHRDHGQKRERQPSCFPRRFVDDRIGVNENNCQKIVPYEHFMVHRNNFIRCAHHVSHRAWRKY